MSGLNFFFTGCLSQSDDESEFISDVAMDEEEPLDILSYKTNRLIITVSLVWSEIDFPNIQDFE